MVLQIGGPLREVEQEGHSSWIKGNHAREREWALQSFYSFVAKPKSFSVSDGLYFTVHFLSALPVATFSISF